MILKKLFESDKQEVTAQQAATLINTKAVNFLKESNGRIPYSGRRRAPSDAFISQYRGDRRPLDSSHDFQEAVDKYIKGLGAKALRSNSLFVTMDYDAAEAYGTPMFIFPLGVYHYHWIDGVGDLSAIDIDGHVDDSPEDIETLSNLTGIDEEELTLYIEEKFGNEAFVSLSDLRYKGIITNDQYLDIIRIEQLQRLEFKIDCDLSDWIDENDVRGHHELVLNSSEGYLAIDPEFFKEEVLPLLHPGIVDKDSI